MATLSTMLPVQSPGAWFNTQNNATTAPSSSPFTEANAVAESILGLPLPEEDSLLGPTLLSPALPTWNAGEPARNNPSTGIDLKNSRPPNSYPAPSPPAGERLDANTNPRLQCQLVPSRADQLEHSPGNKRSNDRAQPDAHHKRRKSSLASTGSDEPPEEKERREKYLERNRIAATKCRQRKKEQTKDLESRFEQQSDKKEGLVRELRRLRTEALCLKDEVLKHAECGDKSIKLHVTQMANNVSHGHYNPGFPDSFDNNSLPYDASPGPMAQTILPYGFDTEQYLN